VNSLVGAYLRNPASHTLRTLHKDERERDGVVNEHQILDQVRSLVDQEHELRARVQEGELAPEEEREQLRRLELALDQCWDLLRQRRARQDAGQDPDEAVVRPVDEVEDYEQ
jgi:Protein of unknown function (DUF2630)